MLATHRALAVAGWMAASHAREGFPRRGENSRTFRLSSSSWHAFHQMHLQISPRSWRACLHQACPIIHTQQHPK